MSDFQETVQSKKVRLTVIIGAKPLLRNICHNDNLQEKSLLGCDTLPFGNTVPTNILM